jgi:hypothetical protein
MSKRGLSDRLRRLDERTGMARLGSYFAAILPAWCLFAAVVAIAVGILSIVRGFNSQILPAFGFALIALALAALFSRRTRRVSSRPPDSET